MFKYKFAILFFATALLCNVVLMAQPNKTLGPDAMKKMSLPGPAHEILKYFIGKWNQEALFFIDPKKEPLKGSGVLEAKMILGGRFLQCDAASTGMGMKFASLSYMGHDNRTGDYTFYGLDELGTYAVSAFGTYDEKNKVFKFTGQELDPYTMEPMGFRLIYKIESEDKYTFNLIFETPDGQEVKYLSAVFTRVKE